MTNNSHDTGNVGNVDYNTGDGGGDDGYGLVTFLDIEYLSEYLPRFKVNFILVGLDFPKI